VSKLKHGTTIDPSAWIGPYVTLGRGCYVGPGAVIGSIGYGYERDETGAWKRRDHPFGVTIGDEVEIGACTVIDRGRYRETVIGDRCKLDAHVFIAHNVIVGADTMIVARSMLAGSVETGEGCWIGPGACVSDHVKLGHGARVGLGAVVLRDVPDDEVWVGNPARFLRMRGADEP